MWKQFRCDFVRNIIFFLFLWNYHSKVVSCFDWLRFTSEICMCLMWLLKWCCWLLPWRSHVIIRHSFRSNFFVAKVDWLINSLKCETIFKIGSFEWLLKLGVQCSTLFIYICKWNTWMWPLQILLGYKTQVQNNNKILSKITQLVDSYCEKYDFLWLKNVVKMVVLKIHKKIR